MKDDLYIQANLNVSIENKKIKALVVLENTTKEEQFIFKDNISTREEMEKTLFDILCNGERVKYIGKSIKKNISKNDFVLLESKEKIEFYVYLDEFYDFSKCKGKYSIQYFVFNPYISKDGFFVIKSNIITLNL